MVNRELRSVDRAKRVRSPTVRAGYCIDRAEKWEIVNRKQKEFGHQTRYSRLTINDSRTDYPPRMSFDENFFAAWALSFSSAARESFTY